MSVQIYYFSGTGNSLFVARELQALLKDAELVPVVKALAEGNCVSRADTVGFVFPTHGLTMPIPVREFMARMDISSASYAFAVATRGGTVFRGFKPIQDALEKRGKRLNASFLVNMAANDPKLEFYRDPTAAELESSRNNALEMAKNIAGIVERKEDSREEDRAGISFTKGHKILNWFLERLVPFMLHSISPRVKKYFYADAKCTGCGTCATVCLSGKIAMNGKKPFWKPETTCYLCYACLNYCPARAVQIRSKWWMKSFTAERGRYCHPHAGVADIAEQKLN